MILVSAMALTACSTAAARRDDPPIIDRVTTRSLAEFQDCFANGVAAVTPPPNYMPRSGGGSYTYTVNSYVGWVVDIDAEGAGNRVRMFSPNSGGDISRLVISCL